MDANDLQFYLENYKISKSEIAKMLNVSRTTVLRWMRGKNQIPCTVEQWCKDNWPKMLETLNARTARQKGGRPRKNPPGFRRARKGGSLYRVK